MRTAARELIMVLALIAALFLGVSAGYAGRTAARGKGWPAALCLALLLTGLVILGHRSPRLSFFPPVSWAVDARVEPFVMAAAIPLMFSVLIARLGLRRQRIFVAAFMMAMFIYFACLPSILPALVRPALLAGKTRMDSHDVCLQTHGYTCGPAAAVTCLRALDISADEGPLAASAQSAPVFGTDGPVLARTINDLYGKLRVRCDYRFIASLDVLTTPAVVTIFSPRFGNHYVAVLAITQDEVIIGDPLSGRDRWTREEFLSEWNGTAHVFAMPGKPVPPPQRFAAASQ